MTCHDCKNPGRKDLIIEMRRVTFCDECHSKRVRWGKPLAEFPMVAQLREMDLTENEKALLRMYSAEIKTAYHWDLALIRSSLRAVWILKQRAAHAV